MDKVKTVWLLDPRFDFLIPLFERTFSINREDILFVGSYHGASRQKMNTLTLGGSSTGGIILLEPEDLNRLYAKELSPGEYVNIISFTGVNLPSVPWLKTLISAGEIANNANNKWWQYQFFQQIGVPTPKAWRFKQKEELFSLAQQIIASKQRLILKPLDLSGGYHMVSVSTIDELKDYCNSHNINDMIKSMLISNYVPHYQSFASMGIIRHDGKVLWCGATEQVLRRDLAYEGLIFPPYASNRVLSEMKHLTHLIGERLASLGYFGFFNVDFIWGECGLHVVELNARLCFGTILFACCCGESFWQAVQGYIPVQCWSPERLILGKLKGEDGHHYYKLPEESDILSWFSNGTGSFQSVFCGIEKEEEMENGSYVGLFGAYLPKDVNREDALRMFWERCLAFQGEQ